MIYDSKDIAKNYSTSSWRCNFRSWWNGLNWMNISGTEHDFFMKYKTDLNFCFKDNIFRNYDFLGEVTLKSFRQVKDYMIINDLLPRNILIICLRMDFISVRTKRFHFQYNMEFFHHFGNLKTLTLAKIKQKHLILICRQRKNSVIKMFLFENLTTTTYSPLFY